MDGLENVAAGFGSGFVSGVADVQKMQEQYKKASELNQIQLYVNLLKSGKWAPVDAEKGVEDGGVVKIGSIGMLAPVKSDAADQKLLMQLARLNLQKRQVELSEAAGQRAEEQLGLSRRTAEMQELLGKRALERPWASKPTSYYDPTTKDVHQVDTAKGEMPQSGWVPIATQMSAEGRAATLDRRDTAIELDALSTAYRAAQAQFNEASKYVKDKSVFVSALEGADDAMAQEEQKLYKEARDRMVSSKKKMDQLEKQMRKYRGVSPSEAKVVLGEVPDDAEEEDLEVLEQLRSLVVEELLEGGATRIRGRVPSR